MTIIATDGNPIVPIVVDNLVSSPGERFDVVVHAFDFQEISKTYDFGSISITQKKTAEIFWPWPSALD